MEPSSHYIRLGVQEDDHVEDDLGAPGHVHPLACVLGALCLPCTACASCYIVQEKEAAVLMSFGRYAGTMKDAGIHFRNCWGRDVRKVSTRIISTRIPLTKIVDANGNSLLISGILTYQFVNAKKALLDVENARQYVETQAQASLKQLVSRYPYESQDHDDDGAGMTLKTESSVIGAEMVSILQAKVDIAGTRIHSFAFDEMYYAPEIASGMLKRQQAAATLSARKYIIEGSVTIAHGAIEDLNSRGITMDRDDKNRLINNLMVVLCSDKQNPVTTST